MKRAVIPSKSLIPWAAVGGTAVFENHPNGNLASVCYGMDLTEKEQCSVNRSVRISAEMALARHDSVV